MPSRTRRIRRSLFPALTALAVMVGLMLLPGTAAAAPTCNFPSGATYEVNETQVVGGCDQETEDGVTATISSQGTHGTATVTGSPGSPRVSYTASTTTDDTFTVSVSDESTPTPVDHVVTTHNVAQVNDPPVCDGETGTSIGHWRVLTTCTDDANEHADVTITIHDPQPAKGTARVVPVDGGTSSQLQYKATTAGTDTVHWSVSDDVNTSFVQDFGTNNSAQANTAPECQDFTGGEGGFGNPVPSTFPLGECTDPDDDVVHVDITQAPTHGAASVLNQDTPDATVQYDATSAGNDTVKYKANDETNDSNEVTVTLCNGGCGFEEPGPTTPKTPPVNPGTGALTNLPGAFSGGNSGGTVTASSNGTLTLKNKVDCTGAGPDCAVTDALSAPVAGASSAKKKKAKTVKLGGRKFTVKTGKKGAIKVKLTKKGLKLLKRKHKIKAKLKVTVKRGGVTTKKTLKVTLKAPKAKHKKK
jgi:hypothetical protein